jgi:hypothetical protein
VGLERGPLSLVSTIEGQLGSYNSGFGLRNPRILPWGFIALTTRDTLSAEIGTNFADKQRSLLGILRHSKATEFFIWSSIGILAEWMRKIAETSFMITDNSDEV